jgi:hypothetical protein
MIPFSINRILISHLTLWHYFNGTKALESAPQKPAFFRPVEAISLSVLEIATVCWILCHNIDGSNLYSGQTPH